MNREQLLDLTNHVRRVAGVEIPIIVGSQSLYAVTSQVPEIVKQSVECDFLLLAVGAPVFRAIIEQVGFASDFQEPMATMPTPWVSLRSCYPLAGKSAFCL